MANRRLRRFRSGAVEKMTGDHPRNTGPMLSSLRCGAKTHAVGQALRVSGGKRKKALPNAWWCAGIRGSARQQERAEARPLYARSHRGTPATAGADAAIAHADSRHRVIDLEPPCRCLGREGDRVRCAVVSIVARGLTSGQKRPRGPRRATDVGIAASLRKDGSVGVDRFGFRVTRQTAGLTFVGMQLRFVRLRHSALHLLRCFSFALAVLRRTTFAATRRLCALPELSGARYGGFWRGGRQADHHCRYF